MPAEKLPPPTEDQIRAWNFYGAPNAPARNRKNSAPAPNSVQPGQQVGEVRYIIGWMADQMVRMGWRVKISGSEKWRIVTPNGVTITSNPDTQGDAQTGEEHPVNASARLLAEIMWDSRTVREVTTNLFVAGELHYALDKDRWRVVSVVRPDRDEIVQRSSIVVHGIWPHPGDPEAPDAPIFGVLGVLDDMLWLNRLSRSQSANRVGMRGIVGVADSFKVSGIDDATGDAFWANFEEALSRPMDDPTDVSPVGLVGSESLVKPEGNGMAGLSWVIPDFPYDEKIDARMQSLISRLAYGLPIPPEILLGLQAQSKATAFQVEGSTYRAHIEPVALLVAEVATRALALFLPDEERVEVVPDPTTILARRHSVQDVLEAFDRQAVSEAYLREVLGIPEGAKPDAEELERRTQKTVTVDGVTEDPANKAADEPVTAAASMPGELGERAKRANDSEEAEFVADLLHRIDLTALHELVGAAGQGVLKARERIGAYLRSQPRVRERIQAETSNDQVIDELGAEACMTALGEKGEKLISSALESTLSWWRGRARKAQAQVAEVLSAVTDSLEFDPASIDGSVAELDAVLRRAVMNGGVLPDGDLRKVLDRAGGQ